MYAVANILCHSSRSRVNKVIIIMMDIIEVGLGQARRVSCQMMSIQCFSQMSRQSITDRLIVLE